MRPVSGATGVRPHLCMLAGLAGLTLARGRQPEEPLHAARRHVPVFGRLHRDLQEAEIRIVEAGWEPGFSRCVQRARALSGSRNNLTRPEIDTNA